MSYYNLQHKVQPAGHNMGQLHSHDFYELEFLLTGERHYYTKSTMQKMKAPTLVVIPPEEAHRFESFGCEVYTLQISTDSLSSDQLLFLNRLAKKGVVRFPIQRVASLKGAYETLNKIFLSFPFDQSKKMSFAINMGNLFYLLYSYARVITNEVRYDLKEDVSPTINPVILKILDYLEKHFKEEFTLDDLTEQFHVSKSYLSSAFNKATHSTIFQYKLSLQLSEAKKLLRETHYSYDKIAKLCGFSSGNYFRLIFKKHEGQTPKQHRYNSLEKRKNNKG